MYNTHINFGFSDERNLVLFPDFLASDERDAEMRKHRAFGWGKEVVRDEANGLDQRLLSDMMADRERDCENLDSETQG